MSHCINGFRDLGLPNEHIPRRRRTWSRRKASWSESDRVRWLLQVWRTSSPKPSPGILRMSGQWTPSGPGRRCIDMVNSSFVKSCSVARMDAASVMRYRYRKRLEGPLRMGHHSLFGFHWVNNHPPIWFHCFTCLRHCFTSRGAPS